jgi:hypothetical protein
LGHWFLTPKHFPCEALKAQEICALKKTEHNISENICRNAGSFLLNGQISVPEWCMDFSETPYSSNNPTDKCHALFLQQHKKKMF